MTKSKTREHSFTIDGEPASKANSRKIVMFGKRPAVIKSDKARRNPLSWIAWRSTFTPMIGKLKRRLSGMGWIKKTLTLTSGSIHYDRVICGSGE